MEKPKSRFVYIDLLRGWAVIVMIEVHVFNAFLIPSIKEEAWFKVLNFINGLVAPSFLFIAGYSFVLIAQRKWNDYLTFSPVFWKQLGRILQVLAVGYALHLPFFSLSKLMSISWLEWGAFWKIDVLHAIAVSLLTLLALVLVTRTQRRYFIAIAAFATAVIFGAPWMYDRNIDHLLPEPIANYFTAAHRSQFPLFPWMAFVFCGGLASQLLVWWKETIGEKEVFKRYMIGGIVFIVGSIVADLLPLTVLPEHNFWRASPGFFFIRLGIVMMLLSTLWYWEQTARSGRSMVSVVGSESLVAYAGHLLAIYGMFWDNKSLAFIIGKTKTVPEVIVMTVLLIAATVAVSYVWNRIKNWSMFYARVMMYSILIVVLYIFCTKIM
ncbi:MAG: heparan-alpha-glucosaminide N-acetyltransferase domain-containing protein [Bacteriovoracaceae bacterium]|nr:heparan-alpha-glucosaminide N-acetyltransferase domain-containing protein [Bacteroidota bacterium]